MHCAGLSDAPECQHRRETLTGTQDDDYIRGETDEYATVVYSLNGLEGDDILIASYGEDELIGGTGRDILVGKGWDDKLTGGPDSDRFVFGPDDGNDDLLDFEPGTREHPIDKIVLLGGTQENIDDAVATAAGEPDTHAAFVLYGSTTIKIAERSPEDVSPYWFTVA